LGWLKPKHTPNPSWTAVVLAIALALSTANPSTVIQTNTVKQADLLAVNPFGIRQTNAATVADLLAVNPFGVRQTNAATLEDLLAVNPSIAVLTEGEIPSAKCLVPACDDTISMTIDKYGL
jgi:outer membrane cobalamin receptor